MKITVNSTYHTVMILDAPQSRGIELETREEVDRMIQRLAEARDKCFPETA